MKTPIKKSTNKKTSKKKAAAKKLVKDSKPKTVPESVVANNDISVELKAITPFMYQGTIPDVNVAEGASVFVSFRMNGIEVARREYKLPNTIPGGKVGGVVNLFIGFMTYFPITPTGKTEVEVVRYT